MSNSPSWSDLPDDIFLLVIRPLPYKDLVCLGAVCKCWRPLVLDETTSRPEYYRMPRLLAHDKIAHTIHTIHNSARQGGVWRIYEYHYTLQLVCFNVSLGKCVEMIHSPERTGGIDYLVESSAGDLFLATRYEYDHQYIDEIGKKVKLDLDIEKSYWFVYVLDKPSRTWGRVASLGGRVMLLHEHEDYSGRKRRQSSRILFKPVGDASKRIKDRIFVVGGNDSESCWSFTCDVPYRGEKGTWSYERSYHLNDLKGCSKSWIEHPMLFSEVESVEHDSEDESEEDYLYSEDESEEDYLYSEDEYSEQDDFQDAEEDDFQDAEENDFQDVMGDSDGQ